MFLNNFSTRKAASDLLSESNRHKEAIKNNSKYQILSRSEKAIVDKQTTALKVYESQLDNAVYSKDLLEFIINMHIQYELHINSLIDVLSRYTEDNLDTDSGTFNTCPISSVCNIFTEPLLRIINFHSSTFYQGKRIFSNPGTSFHYDASGNLVETETTTGTITIGHSGVEITISDQSTITSEFSFSAEYNGFINEYTAIDTGTIDNPALQNCGNTLFDNIIRWKVFNPDNGPIGKIANITLFDPTAFCDDLASRGLSTITDVLVDCQSLLANTVKNRIMLQGNLFGIVSILESSKLISDRLKSTLDNTLAIDPELSVAIINENSNTIGLLDDISKDTRGMKTGNIINRILR
jgi:hypothetical protein